VLAFCPNIDGVTGLLRDGDAVKMGDEVFEVITRRATAATRLFIQPDGGVLFAGDTPLLITSPTGTYETGFLAALEKLCARDVRRIYFGHGAALSERCNERLRESQRWRGKPGGQLKTRSDRESGADGGAVAKLDTKEQREWQDKQVAAGALAPAETSPPAPPFWTVQQQTRSRLKRRNCCRRDTPVGGSLARRPPQRTREGRAV